MKSVSPSPEILKLAVMELIGECRALMGEGNPASAAEIERGVRAYCTAIAALPKDEGRKHTQDLNELMQMMENLSSEMIAARDAVRAELESLGKLRQASSAYKKSETMAGKRKKTEDDAP